MIYLTQLIGKGVQQLAADGAVDNDAGWKLVTEKEAERREELEKITKISFWDKIPAEKIKEEAMAVLPKLKNEIEGLPTKISIMQQVKLHKLILWDMP